MPAPLALVLGYAAVVWLIRQDIGWRSLDSKLLLICAVFLGIIGSRPLSYWLGSTGGSSEGNPINTAFFGFLLVISLVALSNRGVALTGFLSTNKALLLLYAFFLVSAFWSIDAGTSAKRLLKDFVCVLIAIVIRTSPNPIQSCRCLFVRVSYVLFPMSVVFGKYYPGIGRSFSMGGEPMFTGVTTQKNSLGEIAFVFGLFLLWELSDMLRAGWWREQRRRVLINMGVLATGIWLLIVCDSKTSLVCLIIAALLLLSRGWFNRRKKGKPLLVALLIAFVGLFAVDNVLGISETALKALNRNPTLTGRTDIWRLTLEQQHEPWLGGGFYMFWDSEKGRAIADELISLNSAHSGYIETYLDGGAIGCVILGLFVLTIGVVSVNRYFEEAPFAELALPFWVAAVLYNLSESSFMRLDPLWFTLLLVTMTVPASVAAVQPLSRAKIRAHALGHGEIPTQFARSARSADVL